MAKICQSFLYNLLKKFLVPFFVLLFWIFLSGLSQEKSLKKDDGNRNPVWWQVKIQLEAEGSYRSRQKDSSFFGFYSFLISNRGKLVKDEDDFLLYPDHSFIEKWEAQETAVYPQSIKSLTHDDFQHKPSLRLNYILKKWDKLHFDIYVEGFLVPQSASPFKIYLELPASKENSRHFSEIDYDVGVAQGSNQIFVFEADIYKKAVTQSFRWRWKYEKWLLEADTTVFFSHTHNVDVTVTIEPRYN
ncbi:MAG: hypothetical protein JXB26_09360 [Candidatus Aminicenantes bacterium]|nr:hypothetical protein [Candidatus Aminicenantes bacterium]